MKKSRFKSNCPGQLVPIPAGDFAFVPDPLPCEWPFPEELWPLLTEARSRISLLEGVGRTLPNPALFLRPLEDREAIQSSRLEGTYVTAQELLLFEMEPSAPEAIEDKTNDRREVFNYRQALHEGLNSKLPLSLRLIRDMHRILMTGVRGRDKTPGAFRTQQVAIGYQMRFVPPPPDRLPGCLDNFEKSLHWKPKYDPLVECFICHYQFETIHPFNDGNGRIGRLLLALMLQQRCGLTKPWLYLSEFFEKHRDEYCDRMFNVSARSEWQEWIDFCLKGTVEQAEATIGRCERLQEIREDFQQRVVAAGGHIRLSQIVEQLFQSPYLRIADLPGKLKVSYPTAKADLSRLEAVGIVSKVEGSSPAMYYSPDIFLAGYSGVED